MIDMQISKERGQNKSPNCPEKEYDQRILKSAQYKLQRIIGQKITINLLMKILKPRYYYSYIHMGFIKKFTF
jgi:hypothetical protein